MTEELLDPIADRLTGGDLLEVLASLISNIKALEDRIAKLEKS